MFVSKRRFILKTCGTTLLLQALVPLLQLAREYCGFDAIEVSSLFAKENKLKRDSADMSNPNRPLSKFMSSCGHDDLYIVFNMLRFVFFSFLYHAELLLLS